MELTHPLPIDGIAYWEKTSVDHVWKLPDGRFTWTDEVDQPSDITYANFEDAVSALNVYCWYGLEGVGERLRAGELEVTFKKADGTLRTMYCTSKPEAFPIREATERTKMSNPEVQVVWDLEKNAIRSFRKDSIVKIAVRM